LVAALSKTLIFSILLQPIIIVMNKFNEYDVVEATRDLSETIHTKARGTVLLIFKDSPFHYLVEFMDGAESSGMPIVSESDLGRAI
jgi:Domain of unknown function (DUF4926)